MKKLFLFIALWGFFPTPTHTHNIVTSSILLTSTIGNSTTAFWVNFIAGNTVRQKLMANAFVAIPVIGTNMIAANLCSNPAEYACMACASYALGACGGYFARAVVNTTTSLIGSIIFEQQDERKCIKERG
jgi:hypothetical protein